MKFNNSLTERIAKHIEERYDAQPEFLWKRTPDYAIFRHKRNSKWFAAIMPGVQKSKLGVPGEGTADIIDLKCDTVLLQALIDGRRYLPGYHMNKQHWITIILDGSVSDDEIFKLIDMSYNLTA